MTTAGSISLGVDIDANDLRSELTRAVIEEMGPVLAEINAELRKSAKEQDNLGKAVERNAQRQIDANNAIRASMAGLADETVRQRRAYEDVGRSQDRNAPRQRQQQTAADNLTRATASLTARQNEFNTAQELFGRNSSEAEAAYRRLTSAQRTHTDAITRAAAESRNSTDSQINDWRRLAAEAESSRRTQESAFESIERSRRRVSGGGRGGRGSFLLGPGGMALGGLTAQALGPALLGVTNLTGAIVQLSQAGLALPGIFAGGAASIGTAVIGFQGMGDAIKAINKGMAEGASKADAKKMAAALKDMDDNAKAVALTIATDFIPEFKKLQSEVVQHNMFDGIANSLTGLKDKALPTFKRGLEGMSKAWNDTFKRLTAAGGDSTNLSLIDRIFGNSAEGQKRANQAIAPITRAMLQLSSVGSEFLPRLGDGITKLTTRFGNWVDKNVASGQMWKWIDEGLNGFRALGNAVLNVGKILTGLTKAAGGDGGFLGWLEKATDKWQKFVNSTEGQSRIREFFDDARASWKQLSPVLTDVVKLAGDVVAGFKQWGAIILPIIGAVTHALAQLPHLVAAAVTGFAAMRTLGPLLGFGAGARGAGAAAGAAGRAGLLSRIGSGIGDAAGVYMAGASPAGAMRMAAAQRAWQTTRAVGQRLIAPGTLIGAGGLALSSGLQQDPNASTGQRVLGGLGSIASGALIGGTIGSAVPVLGTAVGAGVGALAGGAIALYNDAMGQSARSAQEAAKAQQELADRQQHAADTAKSVNDANRDIANALLNSGGQLDASTNFGLRDLIQNIPARLQDQMGGDAAKNAQRVREGLNMTDEQLANVVSGDQGVFNALITNLQKAGGDSADFAAGLQNARTELDKMKASAGEAAPVLKAIADARGQTNDQVSKDLQLLATQLAPGAAVNTAIGPGADIASRLGQAGINVGGQLSPTQLQQISAALGQNIVSGPGGNGFMVAPVAPLPVAQVQTPLQIATQQGAPNLIPTMDPNNPIPGTLSTLLAPGGPLDGQPKPVTIDVQAPQLPKATEDLGGLKSQMDIINQTPIKVDADTSKADQAIKSLLAGYQSKTITVNVGVNPVQQGGAPLQPGRADGGVFPGYSPGADNLLAPVSGGEGVVIPEAMRALGGGWLYNLNSSFRPGISRRGYATGGVVGAGDGVGVDPLTVGGNDVIGLLTQIRDALLGKGGGAIAQTADNTQTMANAMGPKLKPFGGDVAKGALAGMIKGLGGDPNLMDWGGFNGNGDLLVPKGGAAGMPGTGGTANMAAMAQMLQAFARSGNTADLGMGLSATSPVVRAIVSARNKKTGMSDDAIAGLVGQVLTGGGYQGVLDPTNTSLINALTTFSQKGLPKARGAAAGGVGVFPGFDQALLSQVPAGQYSQTGAADLTKGLADCSSSVEDLVNIMDGRPTAGRTLSTANGDQWFQEHGFLPGNMPGAFNVAFNSGHMQATLPGGTPFNWGSAAAAARGGVGGTGAEDPTLTDRWYRPVDGMAMPSMSAGSVNPLGYSGGPVPVYIVDGPGVGFAKQIGGQIAEGAINATAAPMSDLAGGLITGIDQATQLSRDSTKNRPATSTKQLMTEGNPLSVAALAGYQVPNFQRNGWNGPVNQNTGPGFTANGQMISDTAALIQRTATDAEAAADARQQQMMAVLDQIKTQLSEQVLKPLIQGAVQAAISAAGSSAGGGMQLPGLAAGGPISGGTAGVDSVPAMLMPGEFVLNTGDVARMGGTRSIERMRKVGVRHFATGGGVNVNKSVGADFFGLSQVPLLGPIINLLVNILLQVIGVNIEAADTLTEISDDFKGFRGDFQRFDATGRMTSDTSALSDRSGSSQEKAIDERVRIFKAVLTGLIKFIIQKIIIPITQAVMQTLLSTASSAVSGAITGGVAAAGGGPAGAIAGNLVGGLMNSAGGAAINIFGDLATTLAGAATGPIIDLLTGGLMDMFGGLLSPILSGGIGGLVSMFLPFLAFDSGGLATGMGMMPKATIEPERVLSPRQTRNHERLTELMDGGILDQLANGRGNTTVQIHAPFTVLGGEQGARTVHNRLSQMAKM